MSQINIQSSNKSILDLQCEDRLRNGKCEKIPSLQQAAIMTHPS